MIANLAFSKNTFSKQRQNRDEGDTVAVCAARFATLRPGLLDLNSKEDSHEEANSSVTEQQSDLLDIDAKGVGDKWLQSNETNKSA